MKTLLFQGDSITDALRSRELDDFKGSGYPTIVGAEIEYNYPNRIKTINRGISGNRVVDVYARIKNDIINLKPDYMTILIGVNDVWHEVSIQNGIDTAKYEKIYDMLISEIKEALPEIKIIILEPFILKGKETEENFDIFSKEVPLRAEASKRIAEKHKLPFVPLQNKFDEALKKAPADWWLMDGVHPTSAGHKIIADELIPVLNRIINE